MLSRVLQRGQVEGHRPTLTLALHFGRARKVLRRYIARYSLQPLRYIASTIIGAEWRLTGPMGPMWTKGNY